MFLLKFVLIRLEEVVIHSPKEYIASFNISLQNNSNIIYAILKYFLNCMLVYFFGLAIVITPCWKSFTYGPLRNFDIMI